MTRSSPPRRVLVLGPGESGKSAVAEWLLRTVPDTVYVATGPAPGPDDAEWAARVAAHRARRPASWGTVETDRTDDLVRLLAAPGAPLLVESLGTWLAPLLERGEDVAAQTRRLADAWAGPGRTAVMVAEETGWGVVPATPVGRRFRTCLGRAVQALAAGSDQVLLVVAGRVLELPGGPWPDPLTPHSPADAPARAGAPVGAGASGVDDARVQARGGHATQDGAGTVPGADGEGATP